MTEPPDDSPTDKPLSDSDKVARTMLAALIEVAQDPDTPADLRGMAFAVIAQAEAAGIKVEEEGDA
jgi:uncharacterized protein (UPF0147 family)